MNTEKIALLILSDKTISDVARNQALDKLDMNSRQKINVINSFVNGGYTIKKSVLDNKIDDKSLALPLKLVLAKKSKNTFSQSEFIEIVIYLFENDLFDVLFHHIIRCCETKEHFKFLQEIDIVNREGRHFNFVKKAYENLFFEIGDVQRKKIKSSQILKKLALIRKHYAQSEEQTTKDAATQLSEILPKTFTVFYSLKECFDEISEKRETLFDLRFSQEQRENIFQMFSKALENKNRFVFLRLSDGESYGFTDNNMLIERQEMHWWGEVLDPQTRSTIREEFLDILNREIDLLGIPTPNKFVHYLGYTYRAEMNNAPAEKNAMKRNAITAQGLRAAVAKEKLINTIFCEDQINLLMFTKKYLKELSHFAEKTVVISGFSEDVVTSQLKIQNLQVIEIPTHNQYKENDGVVKGSLPRVYPVIKDKIKQMVSPGTLVIISAGFIGKIFASEVGELGGVTLDLGHQLDLILKDRHA